MSADPLRERADAVLARASALEEEGLPFPTATIRDAIEGALEAGESDRAKILVDRTELLVNQTGEQWTAIKEQLDQAERLRGTAEQIGIDCSPFDVGTLGVREALREGPLSAALFQAAATRVASAISGIEKAIPRHGSAEARKLSDRIQAAKRRGEEVGEATAEFDRLLDALRRREVFDIAARLVETRRAVGRIAIEPTLSLRTSDEEEEILLEARILARRIHRIKRNVRDAQSAARLMSHVRAALSEDRRYGTPQDEIDQLWDEVARLSRERGPADARKSETPETPAPKEEEAPAGLPVDTVVPPEPPVAEESTSTADPPPKRRETGRNA